MNNFKTTTIAAVFFSFIILVSISTIANAQSVSTKDKNYPWEVHIPCVNNFAGEMAYGTVTFHSVEHFDKDGNMTSVMWKLNGGVVTGEVTGIDYHPNVKIQDKIKIDGDGVQTINYVENYKYVGKGVRLTSLLHIKLTINANGEITIELDNSSADCKNSKGW